MESISNSDVNHQYVKLQKYLQTSNNKLKKYKDYYTVLQKTIIERIRSGIATPESYPSLHVQIKPVEKAPLNESLVNEFIESMFTQKNLCDAMKDRFYSFRREKATNIPPNISIKLKKINDE